jgi:hypothetical protein
LTELADENRRLTAQNTRFTVGEEIAQFQNRRLRLARDNLRERLALFGVTAVGDDEELEGELFEEQR